MSRYINQLSVLSALSLVLLTTGLKVQAAFLPVCERTEAVKRNLVTQTKKACEAIQEDDLLAITRVAVSGQSITAFKADDFTGLRNLEILNIRSNPYTALPEGLFNDLVNLNTLVIIGTQLSSYPEDFLETTPLMKELILFRNNATTLSDAILYRLDHMKNLAQVEMDRKLDSATQARLNEIFPAGGKISFRFK